MPPLLKKKNCNKKIFGYNLNKNIFHSKIFLMTNIEIEILFILGLIMVILYSIRCTIYHTVLYLPMSISYFSGSFW